MNGDEGAHQEGASPDVGHYQESPGGGHEGGDPMHDGGMGDYGRKLDPF